MAEEHVERRLAAILAADVVGYSWLTSINEADTRRRFNNQFDEVVLPAITNHRGRLVKTMGDGFLVEFGSVVNAVQCATDIQSQVTSRQVNDPDDRKLLFRIGIHLGDVIVEDEDIHGDGVNIAARLEGLAEAGGICVSDMVHSGVRNKLSIRFDDLGDQSLKNIPEPVHVFAVQPNEEFVAKNKELGVSEKSSIAVLPFDNLSGDPAQDFIGEGLAEDIITGLSRIRAFFVIARNSTFQYKGTSPDVRAVSKELGARYIIEGSSRRSGDRIRINVQLIDGQTGNHLWAERYDREFVDLFHIQDEITQTIVAQLEPELSRAEYERAKLEPPENLDAWELFHRGMIRQQIISKDAILEARRLFQQAIERDPNMACAHAGVAWTYAQASLLLGDHDPEPALRAARRAVELDDKDAFAHLALGRVYMTDRQLTSAIHEVEEAIRINPSYAHAHTLLGTVLSHSGRAEEAIPHLELALRLSPADPDIGRYYSRLARTYVCLKQHEKAVLWAQKAIQKHAGWPSKSHLVSALAHLGRDEEARNARQDLEAFQPGITTDFVREHLPTSHPPYVDHYLEGLRKAGLPEAMPERQGALPLPDKPSIAVLPFENMSGDPEQEYFSDGIAEDIITELSKISALFVIARHSSFTYKGKSVTLKQVGQDLGVRYALEGSVRKAGNRLRITAQLIDTATDHHLWAERYDRDLEDIFAVQDDVTREITAALKIAISQEDLNRLGRSPTKNVEAYDLFLQARTGFLPPTIENLLWARRTFQRIVDMDPTFAAGYAWLSMTYTRPILLRYYEKTDEDVAEAREFADEALRLDDELAASHMAESQISLITGDHDAAITFAQNAVRLQPGDSVTNANLGRVLYLSGYPEKAYEPFKTAIRLDPSATYFVPLGFAYCMAGRFADAIEAFRLARMPGQPLPILLAAWVAAAIEVGNADEAAAKAKELLAIIPDFKVSEYGFLERFAITGMKERMAAALIKAGLPE